MDRLKQLRSEAEPSDANLDTSSPPSEAYMSANDSSSKYFSFTDSTLDETPVKDVSLASAASATDADPMPDPNELLTKLSPISKKEDSFKIGKQIEAANILSGGVAIFEDNDNSFDGDELVIDDNVQIDDRANIVERAPLEEPVSVSPLPEPIEPASKDPEVVLMIDGKNVDAIDIGNGLYLYRKTGEEELAAVQITSSEEDPQTPVFKFLKVRENAEGNLEVYEEFEIVAPPNEAKPAKKTPHVPVKNISKATESTSNKVVENKDRTPPKDIITKVEQKSEIDTKTELNLNGKMMKCNESRKAPVVGSFTPMTYHSTPKKEGKPLTKTMVDQKLHPSRHSDNVKKTIEVHTDNQSKHAEECNKQKSDLKIIANENVDNRELTGSEMEETNVSEYKKEESETLDVKSTETIHLREEKAFVDDPKNTVTESKTAESVEKTLFIDIEKETDPKKTVLETIRDDTCNITVTASLTGDVEVSKISKLTDEHVEGKDILDKPVIISTKENSKTSKKDTNLAKSDQPKDEKIDLETSKHIKQDQVMPTERIQECVRATTQLATDKTERISLPEESTKQSDISSPIELATPDNKGDKDLDEKMSSTDISNKTNLEQSIKIREDKSVVKVVDAVKIVVTDPIKSSEVAIVDDPNTKATVEQIKPVQENESTPPIIQESEVKEDVGETEPKKVSLMLKTNQAVNVDPETLDPVAKEIVQELVSKQNIFVETNVAEAVPKTDKESLVSKACEINTSVYKLGQESQVEMKSAPNTIVTDNTHNPNIVSQINKIGPDSKVELKPFSETIVTDEKHNPTNVSQTNEKGLVSKVEIKPVAEAIVFEKKHDPKIVPQANKTSHLSRVLTTPTTETDVIETKHDTKSVTHINEMDHVSKVEVKFSPETVVIESKHNPKAVSQTNEVGLGTKIEKTTAIETVVIENKHNTKTESKTQKGQDEKVETKSASETTMVERKHEPKIVSQTNEVTVAKAVEVKSLPKYVLLNPVDKKIVPVLPQTYKITNNPKTNMRTETTLAKDATNTHNPARAFELKTVPKTVLLNPVPKGIVPKPPKVEKVDAQIPKTSAVVITSNKVIAPSREANVLIHPEPSNSETKPLNNNHAAVPFGKWTDANRQQFLNQFKEIKVPATSNTKQIKNSNDLNRIDVLKKIDSQRFNNTKAQDKSNLKNTVFSTNIPPPKVETKIPVKSDGLKVRAIQVDTKASSKPESSIDTVTSTDTSGVAPDQVEMREVNVSDLIGRAIVDMLNRPVPMPMTRSPLDEPKHVPTDNKEANVSQIDRNTDQQKLKSDQQKPHTDHRKPNIDNRTEQQKVHIEKQKVQKLNIDQQKLNVESKIAKSDLHKSNTDLLKPKIDHQKLKTDQQTLHTHKLNNDQKSNIEQKIDEDSSGSLDDIEMKMNELHGIPFVERPPQELPRVHKTYSKSSKDDKKKAAIKLLPVKSKQNIVEDNVIDLESDEEAIEHEPVTGDIDLTKKPISKLSAPIKPLTTDNKTESKDPKKKEPVITENEFDKFARRNSITFEDCLTVKFDGKEPANVVQTLKEKDPMNNPKTNMIRTEPKTKLPQKSVSHLNPKISHSKFQTLSEDPNNKNYQTKIHSAYQSALTSKRQMDRPITIIEDKPVKVVFMDASSEFVPKQLNVQGKELSPAKKAIEDTKVSPQAASSNVNDATEDKLDDTKAKTKHQRKQVLTPVEAPELELIQSSSVDFDASPKKKRKTDDNKTEKTAKNLVHKKSYLLGRAGTEEKNSTQKETPVKETVGSSEVVTERTVTAIDNLVKAAELLENQSVHSPSPNPDSQQSTPVKRGRGRPRKYPLPEGVSYSKISPSPQKKPRLIDAKPVKRDPISDEESSDEEEQMIRENWTMGKINENIVCPICNKLFRSENVVFKHVKHCTGVSPTRSEAEKRSPRDSDNKSLDSQSDDMDFDEKPKEKKKNMYKKRKSKESSTKSDDVEVIVIEDTPIKKTAKEEPKNKSPEEKSKSIPDLPKEKPQKLADKPVKEQTLKEIADEKHRAKKLEALDEKDNVEKKIDEPSEEAIKTRKLTKTTTQRPSSLVCEICGKTFRQLSYLANHKLQHKKDQIKKLESKLTAKLQVLSCEVCKKEFRKLHHLVQHRIIHNPEVPVRSTRKSSSEQSDAKVKDPPAPKSEDTSAGFRCEPCDKSFRKLHHLVEHRETHDGINRQKTNVPTVPQTIEKPPPPPQCEVCKKSFRKLHHLIEHKEQHHVEPVEQETSSEKSDDKSVQSSLSTRDIIHECSLCYMVFPNEHSLNKHFVICQQKKKRQSKAKDKPENADEVDIVDDSAATDDVVDVTEEPKVVVEEIIDDDTVESEKEISKIEPQKVEEKRVSHKSSPIEESTEAKPKKVSEIPLPKENEVTELKCAPAKRDLPKSDDNPETKKVIPEKIKKIDDHVKEIPKKTPVKDRVAPTVTKRQKSLAPLPVLPENKPIESDDDEIRYMLNPNFKSDETNESKVFMKVRSNKRSSLQIERPNSRDLMNRRTSLQHPPKIPRLKAKAVEPKVVPTVTKNLLKPKVEVTATDSDDSDVKYSFPEKPSETKEETPKEKKIIRKSMAEKRKSLSGLAKRKSVGQAIAKLKPNPSPVRVIKRRTLDVEHRCDCGQLFNSAALLTRHTSLAHTPPRIRRRRSPAPDHKPPRKSSVKSDTPESRKSKSQEKPTKARRTSAHRGVPVPEKMRKLMLKNAK